MSCVLVVAARTETPKHLKCYGVTFSETCLCRSGFPPLLCSQPPTNPTYSENVFIAVRGGGSCGSLTGHTQAQPHYPADNKNTARATYLRSACTSAPDMKMHALTFIFRGDKFVHTTVAVPILRVNNGDLEQTNMRIPHTGGGEELQEGVFVFLLLSGLQLFRVTSATGKDQRLQSTLNPDTHKHTCE